MSRTTIQCPHCNDHTRIDLSLQLSTQKCDRCGVRFSAINTGSATSKEVVVKEPPKWRRAEIGAWDDVREAGVGQTRLPRWGWAAVGAVLLLAGGTVAFFATRRTAAARPGAVAVQTLLGGSGPAEDSAVASSYAALKARIGAASAVARQFLAARTPDDILPLIQERAQLEPTVLEYYQTGEGVGTLPLPESKLLSLDRQLWVENLRTAVISYVIEGRPQRALALREMEDGRFLVEWPSAVAFNEVPVARFIAERQTTPRLFRLLGSLDDYYNRSFSNDQEFVCVKLTDPGLQYDLYAYARRRSKAGAAVAAARLPNRSLGVPVLTRLRFPEENRSDNQVEIADFLGTGWVESVVGRQPPPAVAPAFESGTTPPPRR